MLKCPLASGLLLSLLLASAVTRQHLLRTVKYLTEYRYLQHGYYHRVSQLSVTSKE